MIVTALTRSVSFPYAENDILMIDFSAACGIISMKRALPISGQLKVNSFLWNRNRHLAEWRFLLFTVIVMVKLPICTVNVMGTMLTPFVGDVANRLSVLWQCSFRPHTGLDLLYQ